MQQEHKIRNMKACGALLLISLILLINGCAQEKSPIKLELSVSPLEENLTQITLTVQSETDIQNITGQINLPEGVELTAGNTQWQINLQANQPQTINITIKTPQQGTHEITATTTNTATPAKVSATLKTQVEPSGYIYETEEEWKAKEETKRNDSGWIYEQYKVCDVECYVPEPLKGKELNNYFKSLNLKEDSVYVILQFELLDLQAQPGHLAEYFNQQENERNDILKDRGVVLLGGPGGIGGAGGELARYAKVPKKFLEEEHYDFIRWIGIKSPEGKLSPELREKVWNKNCTGGIVLEIRAYEKISNEQFETIKQITKGELFNQEFTPSQDSFIDLKVDIDKLKEIASLDFIKTISSLSQFLGGAPEMTITEEEVNPFRNVTCDGEK